LHFVTDVASFLARYEISHTTTIRINVKLLIPPLLEIVEINY